MNDSDPPTLLGEPRSVAADRDGGWERRSLERVALAAIEEQRRSRRWSIFFRFTSLAIALLVLALLFGWMRPFEGGPGRHAALVEITGTIDAEGEQSAELINEALRDAFADAGTAAVLLRINSPGGSPVQAGLVHDEIRRLRAAHPQVPLYAVVEDICASGGYYIAVAADRIYVNRASIVGSIGVLLDSFGFVEAMDKLGVERRLFTAGQRKGFLDPFSPLAPEQVAHARQMLGEIHQQFIDVVRRGRATQLKESPELFSGLVWTGERSIALGLADELGSVRSVARDVVRVDDVVDFTRRRGLAERIARGVGTSAGDAILRSIGAGELNLRLR